MMTAQDSSIETKELIDPSQEVLFIGNFNKEASSQGEKRSAVDTVDSDAKRLRIAAKPISQTSTRQRLGGNLLVEDRFLLRENCLQLGESSVQLDGKLSINGKSIQNTTLRCGYFIYEMARSNASAPIGAKKYPESLAQLDDYSGRLKPFAIGYWAYRCTSVQWKDVKSCSWKKASEYRACFETCLKYPLLSKLCAAWGISYLARIFPHLHQPAVARLLPPPVPIPYPLPSLTEFLNTYVCGGIPVQERKRILREFID
jgi:hypothetical protein